MNANATTALETVLKNSAERPLLSVMVADRAVCRVKCSVVRAWSSRWSPFTANARSPVSGKPDCPAAWTFAMAPPHESGSIHRSSVVLKHALRRYLVKSWLRGGRRRRPRTSVARTLAAQGSLKTGGADEGPALAFETISTWDSRVAATLGGRVWTDPSALTKGPTSVRRAASSKRPGRPVRYSGTRPLRAPTSRAEHSAIRGRPNQCGWASCKGLPARRAATM